MPFRMEVSSLAIFFFLSDLEGEELFVPVGERHYLWRTSSYVVLPFIREGYKQDALLSY